MNRAPPNHATMPDGRQISTLVLAEKLRQCRGRLTRKQMCAEIGLSDKNPKHLRLVTKLCKKYEIAAQDWTVPMLTPAQRARLIADAKAVMAEQIRLAKQEIRSGNKRAYKPGDLVWGGN